jgi:hypothetical protein
VVNIYYELADQSTTLFGGKYFTNNGIGDSKSIYGLNLYSNSDRVWMEQDGKVWFIKNRHLLRPPVDMKEFMWIKLKAETICD